MVQGRHQTKKIRISPIKIPRSAVLARGRMPWANTAERGSVIGPKRNYLMTILLINFMIELSIETRLPCLHGLEKKRDMTSSL